MDLPLDFLVIGAQKCATSWLYLCLRDHPELVLPGDKREREYLGGPVATEKGTEWFASRFPSPHPSQRVGDVSIEYLHDPKALAAILEYAPAVRVIASLRDPVERAVSAYFWNARRGFLPASEPLADTLSRALDENASGASVPASAESRLRAELLSRGYYGEQLERFITHLGPEHVQVVLYDDIGRNPEHVLRDIYGFLGVATDFVPPSLSSRPKQNSYLGPLMRIEQMAPQSRIVAGTVNLLNQIMSAVGVHQNRPDLPADLLVALRSHFVPHIAATERVLTDLPPAQRPADIRLTRRWR